jgi:hypothetical protein
MVLPLLALAIGWRCSPPSRAIAVSLWTSLVVSLVIATVMMTIGLGGITIWVLAVGTLASPVNAFLAWAVSRSRLGHLTG